MPSSGSGLLWKGAKEVAGQTQGEWAINRGKGGCRDNIRLYYRWASAGLEFLKLVCAPRLLATITQTQFEELKKLFNRCLDHMTEAHPLRVDAGKYQRQRIVKLYCNCQGYLFGCKVTAA